VVREKYLFACRIVVRVAGRVYSLVLPGEVLGGILQHAREVYPEEACGVLLGVVERGRGVVLRAAPLRNVLRSRESFWFEEREWMEVVLRGRGEGLEYIGLYHTHPDKSPVPSLSDRHRMLECPGEVWLIVGLEPGGGVSLAAYRVGDDGYSLLCIPVEEAP